MRNRQPRIDWAKLTRTTGTSRRLIESTSEATGVQPSLHEGSQVMVGGLTVHITSITRRGTDVTITAKVLRQVRNR